MDYNVLMRVIGAKYGSCYDNLGYYNKLGRWLEWYKGYVADYHKVVCSNGLTVPSREMYRLNMAKRASEDWTSAVLNEGMDIVINSSTQTSSVFVQGEKLTGGVLGSNNFGVLLSDMLEKMFALGTSAITIGMENVVVDSEGNILSSPNTRLTLQGYNATQILPISYRNGIITDVAFISEFKNKGRQYYYLNVHILEDDGYVIYNHVIDLAGNQVSLPNTTVGVLRTKSHKPLFCIMRTNISNNIDLNSPLGVSIYHNAIDVLKGIDQTYDNCVTEVINGRRIIMMNKNLLTTDEQGNPIAPQDARQTLMQFFGDDAGGSGVSDYIKDFTPNLRTAELDAELQNQLDLFSSLVGLGTKFYNFSYSSGVTATEYSGERQDFIRNSAKMTKQVVTSIKQLIQGILFLGHNYINSKINEDAKVVVQPSDGVIESDTALKEQDRADVNMGLMSKTEYRMKWYGETKEEAEKKLKEIQSGSSISV